LVIVCVAMVLSAVIDGWKFKVPNWLTLPVILTGWLLGLAYDCYLLAVPAGTDEEGSRLVASLAATALGFFLLLPLYSVRGVGGGDVKMQMGFGSWVGAYYGLSTGLTTVLIAFCAGAIVGGVLGAAMILVRGEFGRNLQNTREILLDFVSGAGLGKIAEKAKQRKSRLHLLPYGIPLCIGFLGYLFWKEFSGS
jgi:prepilin peptidase CpaA